MIFKRKPIPEVPDRLTVSEPEPERPLDEGPNGERAGDLRVSLEWNNVSNQWDVSVQMWGVSPHYEYTRWGPFYRWVYWHDEYAIHEDWGGKPLPVTQSAHTTRWAAEEVGCRMLKAVREFTPSGPKNVYINEGDCK